MPRTNYKHSEETKRKIGEANKISQRGKVMSEEARKKMGDSRRGVKRPASVYSEEWRKKQSEAHKGKKAPWVSLLLKGKTGRAKGKKWTSDSRERIKGVNNPAWKGGKTPRSHHTHDREYKEWRTAVFERDSFTCSMCHNTGGYLEAHHIKSWVKYPELRFVVSNGVTLCWECHQTTKGKEQK